MEIHLPASAGDATIRQQGEVVLTRQQKQQQQLLQSKHTNIDKPAQSMFVSRLDPSQSLSDRANIRRCGAHGQCNYGTSTCVCAPGWTGPACLGVDRKAKNNNNKNINDNTNKNGANSDRCPATCQRNPYATCMPNSTVCLCEAGRMGTDCEDVFVPSRHRLRQLQPLSTSSLHSFSGDADTATTIAAAQVCGGHGHWDLVTGRCICTEPWTGRYCDNLGCAVNLEQANASNNSFNIDLNARRTCSGGRGVCLEGQCYCHPHYFGPSCEYAKCPSTCSGHGTCDTEFGCVCKDGFTGAQCERWAPFVRRTTARKAK